jgi:conjugative transfer ATPase
MSQAINFMIKNLFKYSFSRFLFNPLIQKFFKTSYTRPSSLSEKLPWMEYSTQKKYFLLDDGKSVAAIFEINDVASEGRSENYLSQLHKGLQGLFQDVFPQYFDNESPWIVQIFVQDELSLKQHLTNCENYATSGAKDSEFTQHYLEQLKSHADLLTQPEGAFVDTKVSGLPFRGKYRKVRLVVYRRLNSGSRLRRGRNAIEDLQNVSQSLIAKLEGCGVKVKTCTGADFYSWMVKWFNPAPKIANENPDELLEMSPYPGDDAMPFGYDFSEKLFFSVPESDHQKGVWYFDQKPHKYLSILGLNSLPQTGHLSLERSFGNYFYALFDKFPAGSAFPITVVIQSQEAVKNHIFAIEHSTKRASSTESEMAREDCAVAKRAIESVNYFFPCTMGVYLRGDDLKELYDKETEVETLLTSNGFHVLNGDHELTPIDSYLRFLPMCYSYTFDKARLQRSRYLSGNQIAKLLPLYGRQRGTEHPAITFYNRGGEPLTFDPFHSGDKDFNSHLLLLGTTGSGKSALCVYLMMQLMAFYRPRLVIVDAGNSFGLLGDYFKTLGLSVNRVEISFNKPTSLNPFAESRKMLAQLKLKKQRESFADTINILETVLTEEENHLEEEIQSRIKEATPEELTQEENRDYLGEMALAAQLMITGGEKKEIEAITRQDRYWILKAVIKAAESSEKENRDQMIAEDLIHAFDALADELETENKKSNHTTIIRLKKMAEQLNLFCQDNLSSLYFNTPGKPWPEADVTILEMGIFKDDGYEAQRALAFMGAMNKTISLAEQHQSDERFTVFFADECHIVTSNPITAVAVTKCAKMSRKLGLWIWLASQNIKDFPDDARKMLSMIEFWLCLGMSEAELSEVERFKLLTEEERILFRSVRKEAKKYVEGVILCNRFKSIFRNVPPKIALGLAMTEKHEKAERQRIMKEFGCSEVEAAILL